MFFYYKNEFQNKYSKILKANLFTCYKVKNGNDQEMKCIKGTVIPRDASMSTLTGKTFKLYHCVLIFFKNLIKLNHDSSKFKCHWGTNLGEN